MVLASKVVFTKTLLLKQHCPLLSPSRSDCRVHRKSCKNGQNTAKRGLRDRASFTRFGATSLQNCTDTQKKNEKYPLEKFKTLWRKFPKLQISVALSWWNVHFTLTSPLCPEVGAKVVSGRKSGSNTVKSFDSKPTFDRNSDPLKNLDKKPLLNHFRGYLLFPG